MACKVVFVFALSLLLFSSLGVSALERRPETVSPGELVRLVQIRDDCPTFSWGGVAGADHYELVVYAVSSEAAEADSQPEPRLVLEKRLPGSVSSWTPSLEACLQPGGRYAWVVRAAVEEGMTEWSEARLFAVDAGPSEAELERALRVVRRYMSTREAGLAEQDEPASAVAPRSGVVRQPARAPQDRPQPKATSSAPFSVDGSGNVQAASFTGDGAGITNVTAVDLNAAGPCVSESELDFDPATQAELTSELAGHAGNSSAHHIQTVDTDTTCNGAACDGTSFTNLQWSNLQGVPDGFYDEIDHACTVVDNGNLTATLTCNDGSSLTWYLLGFPTEEVAAGETHSCALQTDGSIACWGDNSAFQSTPPAGTFTQVTVGGFHSCGLQTDGSVACWGFDDDGQATPPTGTFTQVAGGWYHSCGVQTGGSLACWGDNDDGQATPPTGTFTQVAAGRYHSCGVKADNTVACWGDNTYGRATPPTGTFTQVAAGETHSCGVKTDNTVACWGDNSDGQSTPPTGTFIQVAAGYSAPGYSHTCGVQTDGIVACWGENTYSQSTPPPGTFIQVEAGGPHNCGVRTDNGVTCWGYDGSGQSTPPPGLK